MEYSPPVPNFKLSLFKFIYSQQFWTLSRRRLRTWKNQLWIYLVEWSRDIFSWILWATSVFWRKVGCMTSNVMFQIKFAYIVLDKVTMCYLFFSIDKDFKWGKQIPNKQGYNYRMEQKSSIALGTTYVCAYWGVSVSWDHTDLNHQQCVFFNASKYLKLGPTYWSQSLFLYGMLITIDTPWAMKKERKILFCLEWTVASGTRICMSVC